MTRGEVRISAEVRGSMPPAVAERVETEAGKFLCAGCRVPGSVEDGDDVSVVVVQHSDGQTVTYAHAGCAPSQLIVVEGKMPAPAAEDDVVSQAAVLPSMDGPRPMLIIERHRPAGFITTGGDVLDPWISGLLDASWHMLTGLGNPQLPPPPGWVLELDPDTERGQILGPEGEIFLDSMPELPGPWVQLVVQSGQVSVVAGRIGMPDGTDDTVNGLRLLGDAARAVQLVAATVPVLRVSSPGDESSRTRQVLADALRDALHTRARPGGSGHLNTDPSVVSFGAAPILHRVSAHGMPLLLVDLDEPDEATSATVMREFEHLGLVTRYSWDDGLLKLLAEGWFYLLWPSQIYVAVPGSDGDRRKLLFQAFDLMPSWYELVRDSPGSGLGLVVGNLRLGPVFDEAAEAALDEAMRAGRVLAGAMVGMLAS